MLLLSVEVVATDVVTESDSVVVSVDIVDVLSGCGLSCGFSSCGCVSSRTFLSCG